MICEFSVFPLLDGKLFLISPFPDNFYLFFADDNYTTFVVNWTNYFINEAHDDGKFLNEILQYPMQFEDLEDDGILMSKKYVILV